MKFGKLESIDGVDFAMPADHPATGAALARRAAAGGTRQPAVLVGTSGWSDAGYVGPLYPEGTRSRDFLRAYGRCFPTNELNSTFYGVDPARIERWAAQVPAGFKFCPKLPSAVSHDRRLKDCDREMEAFLAAAAGFGDTLGRVWTVAPPRFDGTCMGDLTRFVERWAPRVPLAIELREPTWFSDPRLAEAWGALFEAHGVVGILTDVAGRRDVLHMRLTAGELFLRFVGNALHPSDFRRLDDWVERLGAWLEQGLGTAYLFMHMAHEPHTVDLARHLLPALARRTGLPLAAPEPGQSLDGQLELF